MVAPLLAEPRAGPLPFYELRDNPLTSRQQILIAGVSCLVILVLAAGAVSQSPPRKANSDKTKSFAVGVSPAPTPDQARGKRLFEGHCARCHGMQGGGGAGANLRRSKLRHAANDESLFDVIRNGIRARVGSGARTLFVTNKRVLTRMALPCPKSILRLE